MKCSVSISKFLKRSLIFPILLFSSISLHWSLRKTFLSLIAILGTLPSNRYTFPLPFSLSLFFFSQLFVSSLLWYILGQFHVPPVDLCKSMLSNLVSQFCHSVMSDSLRPHESQHTGPPSPSPTPGVHSNSHPSIRWCHPAISSSVVPFSSCLQSLPALESFPTSQLFAWGGQSIGVSA